MFILVQIVQFEVQARLLSIVIYFKLNALCLYKAYETPKIRFSNPKGQFFLEMLIK